MFGPSSSIREYYQALGEATIAKRSDICYERGELDRESWLEIATEGVWKLAVPKCWDGAGGSWWDFVAAFEGLAQGGRDLGFSLSMVAQAGLIRSLLYYGTTDQIAEFLPPLTSGKVGATALTETRGGSDVSGVTTCAVSAPGGYVLSGAKDHVTNGPIADLAMILGRIPEVGSRDITLFMVDMANPGVEHGKPEDMIGNRTSPTGPFTLHEVEVPESAVIGGVGEGLSIIYNTISLDRLLYGVLASAYLEPVLSDVINYSFERVAFKQPIADYQYVQSRITDIKFGIETSRWMAYAALESLLAEDPQANLRCSIAKYHGSETLHNSTEHLFRILGHLGYMNGQYSRRLLDGLGPLIAGGTSEMQRKNVFQQLIKLREEVSV
ncbi:acyl-CoA dehydrogenase family protein [Nocardia terpenica]|uniref:Acyl-CoA dehydrogenase n=1 Tax=Nocardia terpenica TaxID=455432 RepID=A0A161XE75_9NOCA|nr:acyl-CoA dehydrogenase family protein [Nocardia terpenica]KZM71638.1 acyl-CoA dehydrogenase [Nocardia terpenica]NQE90857.1 acyl-CoA/acyl-ACP dehydrogenase [Nocardia terpenica]